MAGNSIVYFDSEKHEVRSSSYLSAQKEADGFIQFNIASGFISMTEIVFEAEGIKAVVTAYGNVEFYDNDKTLLCAAEIPAEGDGAGRYRHIRCKVEDGKIALCYPRYTWVDYYPHCDGESDRWEEIISGYKAPVVFDIATRERVI